ncbi:related to transcription factor 25 [Cephalotrichum gorgonifer]|uniref:Related to transcription factor 25 n=1 Tax=Cephalotrichum gorgonifer TaxID=2041049 RepID=A0AAE8SWS1_9PEZI|nr:related to transcription factor 25 [Cephalotrichum gorgonifer]
MSSRQLRKIRQQQELLIARKPEEDGESGEEEEVPLARPRASLFAALSTGNDDDDDDDANDNEDAEEREGVADRDDEQTPPAATPKKKKKKKKKAKGKKKQGPSDTTNPDEDEIDRALKELNIQPRASPGGGVSPGGGPAREGPGVLEINPYHLRAVHEMKSLFGREVIEAARLEEEAEAHAARRRMLHGGQREVDLETYLKGDPGKKLPEVTLRRNIFIQGKDNWPRAAAGGLVMREVGNNGDGSTEFTFVHEKQYDAAQTIFFHCVGVGDPMRMVHLLKQFPYHVSTLLQVSAFAKQDQNQALAADLCERALFSFGRVTLSSFRQNLERGRARLDFRRPENRQFWLAGYHYLKSLIRKGTNRTALEWAKLLFALDPERDPYGMNHLIHILAVRSHQPAWLESFIDTFKDGSLYGEMRYYRNSLILGWIQNQEDAKAKARLVEEIEATPWLYCALLQALGLDAPPSVWGVQPPGEVDAFYTALYIEMTKDLWNYPRYTSILKEATALAKKQSDLKSTNAVLELRTARFVYLEGNTKLMGLVPRHYLERQPNYEFDPLPPDKATNIFSGHGTALAFEEPAEDNRVRDWMRGLEARARRAQQAGVVEEESNDEGDIPEELRDVIFGGGDESGSEWEVAGDNQGGIERAEGLETGENLPSIQQSIYDTLMQIFSGRQRAAESGEGGGEGPRDGDGEGEGETVEDADPTGLPGAWPEGEGR